MLLYDSIEKVEKVFLEYGDPRWSLYSGKKSAIPSGTKAETTNLLYQQENDIDLHESWNMLKSRLALLAPRGGYGHVFVGKGQQTINIPLYFPHPEELRQNGVVPSPYPVGMQGLGLGQSIADVIEKERRMWDLEQEVRGLREGGSGGFWDKLADNLLQSEQLPVLINGFMGLIANLGMQRPAAGGLPAVGAAAPMEHTQGENDNFRARLQKHFSGPEEMEEALERVAQMIEANPEGMKKALGL